MARYIELGETADETAMREVEEEAGLRAHGPRVLGTSTWQKNFLVAVRMDIDEGVPLAEPDTEVVLDPACPRAGHDGHAGTRPGRRPPAPGRFSFERDAWLDGLVEADDLAGSRLIAGV